MKRSLVIAAFSLLMGSNAFAQSWVYTGSMFGERRHHVTHTLRTGKVLVAGGTDQVQVSLRTCELYDPATGEWTQSSPMSVARERHTLNELEDGRLVIIGGNAGSTSGNQLTGSIEIYDPASDTWSEVASLRHARQNHASVLMQDGRILVIGGYTGDVTASCEIYDPVTNTVGFSDSNHVGVASLNVPRHEPQAALLNNGEVIVIGGRGHDYLRSTEIYNPTTNSWREVGDMNQPRTIGSLIVFKDGTVLTTGGRKSSNLIAPGAEVFDLNSETWKEIEPLHQARHWQGNVLMPNNRYLITGGYYDGDLSTNSVVDCTPICEWYNKDNETWYYAPQLNLQRGQHGAVYFKHFNGAKLKENVIVTGGIIEDYQITNTCEILDVTEEAINTYMLNQPKSEVIPVVPNGLRDQVVITNDGGDMILGSKLDHAEYTIMSATGQILNSGSLEGSTLLNLSKLDLASGLYFIQIRTGSHAFVIKVML